MKKLTIIALLFLVTLQVQAGESYVNQNYFTQTLKFGTKENKEVMLLQAYLIKNNFLKGTPNGSIYSTTQAAIKKFQKAKGLKETGIVDASTRYALNYDFYMSEKESVTGICGFDVQFPGMFTGVTFPLELTLKKIPNNNQYCNWTDFEGMYGTASLYYKVGSTWKYAGEHAYLTTSGKVAFKGTMLKGKTADIKIVFREENPSGMSFEKQFTIFATAVPALPVILTAMSPASYNGEIDGGGKVFITGQNLNGNYKVYIGGKLAAVQSVSDTSMTVIAPELPKGKTDLYLFNDKGVRSNIVPVTVLGN